MQGQAIKLDPSHPAWGGGIEIEAGLPHAPLLLSHPAWGGGIEIHGWWVATLSSMSHPAWGGGIEIEVCRIIGEMAGVPPRMGWGD